jgi:hypothetical protein
MKYFLLFCFFICLPEFFQAALPLTVAVESPLPDSQYKKRVTVTKPSPITRSLWKRFLQRITRQDESVKPDRVAKTSWWIGLIALLSAIYPWYTLLVAIPLGIISIALAKEAKKSGSTKRNGRGLGTVALVVVLMWGLVFAAMLSMASIFEGVIFGSFG